jgi:nucleoid-associated protein EbfC
LSDPESTDDATHGGLDGLLSQAMEMQQQVIAAQARAAEETVEGQAGGGAVRVAVTGAMEFRSVQISPGAVDPDDVEMLQDLVLAALHDAMDQVAALQSQSLGGLGDLLGGSGLGDMLGGADAPVAASEDAIIDVEDVDDDRDDDRA